MQVITWFPAVVLMREKYCPCLTRLTPIKRCVLEEGQERWITIFLRDRLAPLMRRYRFVLVAAAVVVAAGSGAVCATMFKPADKIPLFKQSHPIEEMLRIQWEEFHNSRDWKIEVKLVYGLQTTPISYVATTQILPAEYGGTNRNSRELSEFWVEEMERQSEWLASQCQYRTDETHRVGKSKLSGMLSCSIM